jgi:hypothetical protein
MTTFLTGRSPQGEDRSGSFPPAFTHLSATFPVAERWVKRLKEKHLTRRHSENGGKDKYGQMEEA